MKISICDVCYRENSKLVYGKYKISYKSNIGAKLGLDVCEKHKDYFKTCKNFDEAEKKTTVLYSRPVTRFDLLK